MEMKEIKLHPCYCGGEMKIRKVSQHYGMDGTYWNWELTCNKCGLTKTYAADDFYGRKYKTFEEVVDDWNKKKEEMIKAPGQEPCEDAVSRHSAIFLANDLKQDLPDDEHIADMVMAHNEGILEYQTQLSLLPPVTPQPKMGRWAILKDEYGDVVEAVCSNCDKNGNHKWAFCPNCGAKMQEVEE